MNNEVQTFIAQLRSARERTSDLQHLLARRASVLQHAMTELRLGVPVEQVSARIVKHVRASLEQIGCEGESR